MWCLVTIHSSFKIWFSDGRPIGTPRGGFRSSSRLIVDRQGFLDLTDLGFGDMILLDANGSVLSSQPDPERFDPAPPLKRHGLQDVFLSLFVANNGSFTLSLTTSATSESATIEADFRSPTTRVSGTLKPLPNISAKDAAFIDDMIARKYIPYEKIPDDPGKTVEEIRVLGQRLFGFSPYSFQLAMCVYDWTTASFSRLVFLKIFEYTGIAQTPFPIDEPSIAEQIYASNWGTYTPQNADFMNSFMMEPSSSLDDVKTQLKNVAPKLHEFSDVQNRLLSAAMQALPRTSCFSHTQLFSGQVDIYQLGLDHFGIEFLECPLNKGPVSQSLIMAFASAMDSYISKDNLITTKMVWSFTDTLDDAMHYSNGILLVANHPGDSAVWENAAYITTLSDNPNKTEYTFMPGSQFEVLSVDTASFEDKQMCVIVLQPKFSDKHAVAKLEIPGEAKKALPAQLKGQEVMPLVEESFRALKSRVQPTSANAISLERAFSPGASNLPRTRPSQNCCRLGRKTGGRRCVCIDMV